MREKPIIRWIDYWDGRSALVQNAVEGSRQGGGYEWTAAPVASPMRRGHTCIELDRTGKISRLTTIYDSSLLSLSAYSTLVGLSAEAPM